MRETAADDIVGIDRHVGRRYCVDIHSPSRFARKDISFWRRGRGLIERPHEMVVCGDLVRCKYNRFLTACLAKPGYQAGAWMRRHSPAQIRQCEVGCAVTSVSSSQNREQRGVLTDG